MRPVCFVISDTLLAIGHKFQLAFVRCRTRPTYCAFGRRLSIAASS